MVECAAVAADLARGHHRLLRRSKPVVINSGLLSTLCPDTEPASPSATWPIIAGAVFGAVAIIGILIVIFLKIRKMELALRQANLQRKFTYVTSEAITISEVY